MKKQTKPRRHQITVPTSMKNDIEALGLSATNTRHLAKFVGILKRESEKVFGRGNFTAPKSYSTTYFREVFNSRYLDWLNPAIKAGIIIRNDSYSTTKNIAKKYNINYSYYDINNTNNINNSNSRIFMLICYHINSSEELQTLATTEFNDGCKNNEKEEFSMMEYEDTRTARTIKMNAPYLTKYIKDLSSLTKDENKMKAKVIDKISKFSREDLLVNREILNTVIGIYNGEETKYYSLEKYLEIAKKEGKDIIQYKTKFYMETVEKFIQNKKVEKLYSAFEGINDIMNENYRASRNTTNNRLDTNFTNMDSEIVEALKEDNDLVELDMANSQFSIFSHILEDEGYLGDDVERFKQLCYNGELYTHIQKSLGLRTRDEAKSTMFEVSFGEGKYRTRNYKRVSELFPNVIKWVEDYKAKNGYKQFSIMLQKKESEIFIDDIYGDIKSWRMPNGRLLNMFLLTKHDSLIIRREDLAVVTEFVQEYFDSIGFLGRLR